MARLKDDVSNEQNEQDEIQNLNENEIEEPKPVKESRKRFWLRVLIYVVVIVVLIFLVLFLISRAALYDSIGHMLRHMWGELQLMGERIAGGARR